jgi:hypothetical protein
MTTIHLTDAQRNTFAACGLIVIDGIPHANYADEPNQPPKQWSGSVTLIHDHTDLGCFTIPALLPVVTADQCVDGKWPEQPSLVVLNPPGWHHTRTWMPDEAGVYRAAYEVMQRQHCVLDPLPRPGQFIARPEPVK